MRVMPRQLLYTAVMSVAALPAYALSVTKTVTVAAPPATVWKTIGDFCGIGDWHPAVAKCELSTEAGKPLRTLSLNGGGTIVEKQLSRSDAKMRYTYAIESSPLPVDKYVSTLSVKKDGDGSKITWTGHFVAKGAPDAKAEDVIGGIYDAGLKGISDKSTAQ